VCIAEGETLANPRRIKRFSAEQYFKTQAQIEALFADLPSALANSVAIARRCNLQLTLGKPQLPNFPDPRRHGAGRVLPQAVSSTGLEQRLRCSIRTRPSASASARAMPSGWSSRSSPS
jgi:DNA polymerase III subunit alpha